MLNQFDQNETNDGLLHRVNIKVHKINGKIKLVIEMLDLVDWPLSNKILKCPICPYNSNRINLHNHFRRSHVCKNPLDDKLYECHLCDKQLFDTENELIQHLNSHVDAFECQFCHLTFRTNDSLNHHKSSCLVYRGKK